MATSSAAEGIPPLAVKTALLQYFADKELGMDGRGPHAAQWQAARELTAEFYGLSDEEIGICSCSSEASACAAVAKKRQFSRRGVRTRQIGRR